MTPAGQLIKTRDGGYAFTENTIVPTQFYKGLLKDARLYTGLVKLDSNGKPRWHCRMENPPGNLALSGLLEARNGDYYLMGMVQRPEPVRGLWPQPMEESPWYPAIVRIDAQGQRVPYKVQSTLSPIGASRITYGLEVTDGLIFFGLKRQELPQNAHHRMSYNKAWSPWIFKIDHHGAMIWEHLVQIDDGRLVQDPDEVYSSFAKPMLDTDGTVVVATTVSNLHQDPKSGLYEAGTRANEQNPYVIVMRLSSDGNELERVRVPRARRPRSLLPTGNGGYQIFSAMYGPEKQGVVRSLLDKDLKAKSEEFVPIEDFYLLDVVPSEKRDEFFLLGSTFPPDSNRNNASVIHIDQSRRIARQIHYGRETDPCGLVRGNGPGEVALVYQQQGTYGDAHFVRLSATD